MSKRVKRNVNNPTDLVRIKELLASYTMIHERHIPLLPVSYSIKYIDKENGDFFYGGQIMKVKDNMILLRKYVPGRPIIWNVDPKKYVIYLEDMDAKILKRKQKNNLYNLYRAGLLKLVD